MFRHYWVVLKLLITTFATVILLIYMETFRQMADVAADPVAELGIVRNPSPLVHAILALVLLLIATVLGIYKPFGMTSYGKRKQYATPRAWTSKPRALYLFGITALGILLLLFVLLHLMRGNLRH